MRARTTRPTVLCGAGISTKAGLPDGQQLAGRVLKEVWSQSRVFGQAPPDAVGKALKWHSGREPDLRLELVLELLSHHLDAQVLVEAFRGLNGAVAARAHVVLALAPTRQLVTTNQDVLLEQAIARAGRRRSVLHLHGDCHQPRYISTLISQYVVGLKRHVSEQFKAAIADRHVVVVGYSGRDRDVLPYLHAAGEVTWLHYQPEGHRTAVPSELQRLIEALPGRVNLVRHPNPIDVLEQSLSRSARAVLVRLDQALARQRTAGSWTWDLPREVMDRYGGFDPVQRDLALARVLTRVGENDLALAGLRILERQRSRYAPQVHHMLGNLFFTSDPDQALHHYRLAARTKAHPAWRAAA
ncbi:MAG TPA: SIR2 family protein [Solirubrobacteraceae bacterium]